MAQKSLQIVGPAYFQREEAQQVQLPSQQGTDKCVLLRRPDLVDLISGANGEVPDVLTNLVLSMLDKGKQGSKQSLEITRENLPQIMQSMNAVAIAAFVSPKLWNRDTAEGDYIPASWVSFNDRAFVFAWALGAEYPAVESFRQKPTGDAAAVPPLSDVPAATE